MQRQQACVRNAGSDAQIAARIDMSQRSVCTKSSLFTTNAKVLVVRGFLNFHFFAQKSVLGSRDNCKMCAFLELECACPAAVENRHSQSHGIFILRSH